MNAGLGKWLKTGIFYLVLIAGAVLFIFPFYWMAVASIKTPREVFDLNLIPSEITFQSYNYMLDRIPVARSLFNSFVFAGGVTLIRSEEHTSELQSRENLVCRLLLEKKNN